MKGLVNKEVLENLLFCELSKYEKIPMSRLSGIVERSVQSAIVYNGEINALYEQLLVRIVHFTYRKADGSIREAWGTLNTKLFDTTIKGNRQANTCSCLAYFDLEKNEWRCFKYENLIEIYE